MNALSRIASKVEQLVGLVAGALERRERWAGPVFEAAAALAVCQHGTDRSGGAQIPGGDSLRVCDFCGATAVADGEYTLAAGVEALRRAAAS